MTETISALGDCKAFSNIFFSSNLPIKGVRFMLKMDFSAVLWCFHQAHSGVSALIETPSQAQAFPITPACTRLCQRALYFPMRSTSAFPTLSDFAMAQHAYKAGRYGLKSGVWFSWQVAAAIAWALQRMTGVGVKRFGNFKKLSNLEMFFWKPPCKSIARRLFCGLFPK